MNKNYYVYGNKGSLWSNNAHAAFPGESTTVCGKPMLATNWCGIQGVNEVQCEECKSKLQQND